MKRVFQYFDLSSREQRGFLFLSTVALISLLIPVIHDFFQQDRLLKHDIAMLENLEFSEKSYNNNKGITGETMDKKAYELKQFDPNGVSLDQWISMGLSKQQAQVIKNYVQKGGVFRKKEDLKKIYSLSASDYERLEKYIDIKADPGNSRIMDSSLRKVDRARGFSNHRDMKIDINKADSSELVKLRGIGPVLAMRIMKFREALGGFVSIEQVGETYGLPEDTFAGIRNSLVISNMTIRKLAVNTATKMELAIHPYISNKQAQWIVNYREQHGAFKNIESLSGIEMLNSDFLRKIEPYLNF